MWTVQHVSCVDAGISLFLFYVLKRGGDCEPSVGAEFQLYGLWLCRQSPSEYMKGNLGKRPRAKAQGYEINQI